MGVESLKLCCILLGIFDVACRCLFSYSITLIGILLLLHNAAGKSSGEFELVLSCSAARQYGMEIRKSSVEGSRRTSLTAGDVVEFVQGLTTHQEIRYENSARSSCPIRRLSLN
jgi:hypothetical protein